jgi:hypothetical protein
VCFKRDWKVAIGGVGKLAGDFGDHCFFWGMDFCCHFFCSQNCMIWGDQEHRGEIWESWD